MEKERKEIDLCTLIVTGLKVRENYNNQIKTLLNENKIKIRNFNNHYMWKRKKATYFVESLILGCEVHPFIIFKKDQDCFICDGVNRYLAIKKFINNEFKLEAAGLTRLTWLANKRFCDLTEKEQNYFLHNIFISYIEYYYENKTDPFRKISEEEEIAIQKQLYVRYNSGIKLAIEELQKAQFEGEFLTEKFREKLNCDEKYKQTLKKLYVGGRVRKENEIDSMLVDIRTLIASTYSEIRPFCYCNDKAQRINIYYEDRVCAKSLEEKELIFDNFNICIHFLDKIFTLKEWDDNPLLHNKYFIQVLYWGISVIRRDNKYSLSKIDLHTLVDYFGKREEEYNNFVVNGAHMNKTMIERYFEMAKYFKKFYALDLTKEFEKRTEQKKDESNVQKINVQDVHYRCTPLKISVETFLDNLKNFKYNLRPSYQRYEVMDVEASSRVIESMISGIIIPPILSFQTVVDDDLVFEIIDGQQRLLSILAFTNSLYKNEKGEECVSKKDGFSLKGLDIYYECNGRSYNYNKTHKMLNEEIRQKIMDTNLYVVQLEKGNDIDARDHFVRLNSNISPLRHNFLYWNAIGDQEILDKVIDIAKSGYEMVLGKNNIVFSCEQNILALSYLFYHINEYSNFGSKTRITLSQVSNWLKSFNYFKQNCLNIQKKEYNKKQIEDKRQEYLNSVLKVEQFLFKIQEWLQFNNKDIRELFCVKKSCKVSLKNLVCLANLLKDISIDDLKINSSKIEEILKEFFTKIHEKRIDLKSEEKHFQLSKEKIDILDSNIEYDIYKKMNSTLY